MVILYMKAGKKQNLHTPEPINLITLKGAYQWQNRLQ